MITSSTVSSQSVLPTRLHYKLNQHIQYIFSLNLKCRNCLQKFVSAKSLELVSCCSCYLNLNNKLVNKKFFCIIYIIQIICVCIHFYYNKIIFAFFGIIWKIFFLLLTTFNFFTFKHFYFGNFYFNFQQHFYFYYFLFCNLELFYYRMFNFYKVVEYDAFLEFIKF